MFNVQTYITPYHMYVRYSIIISYCLIAYILPNYVMLILLCSVTLYYITYITFCYSILLYFLNMFKSHHHIT